MTSTCVTVFILLNPQSVYLILDCCILINNLRFYRRAKRQRGIERGPGPKAVQVPPDEDFVPAYQVFVFRQVVAAQTVPVRQHQVVEHHQRNKDHLQRRQVGCCPFLFAPRTNCLGKHLTVRLDRYCVTIRGRLDLDGRCDARG